MRTSRVVSLLGALLLAPSFALGQHDARPRRTMQPFRSETELLQFFAAIDQARPSRQVAPSTCPETASSRRSGKSYVITGRVQDSTGAPLRYAQVRALQTCVLTAVDGSYRLAIPIKGLPLGSKLAVTASFLGYHRESQAITLRRRKTSADFQLTPSPVELEEATVVTGDLSAAFTPRDESITNTQHAGVDEGGIVKLHGDDLVVLRRGRLFTVSVRQGELRPVATMDAYAPGTQPADWYDELLIVNDRVVVIGYSYRWGGTEVGLFDIDRDGELRYVSTAYLRSNDYYSSRNYASRVVDDKLVFYTPLLLPPGSDPLVSLPAVREWRPDDAPGEFERIVTPRRVYRPARSLAGIDYLTLHTITQCDIGGARLECDASVVVGPYGRVFYVSPRAVYVWTTEGPWNSYASLVPSMLYRLPLDGSAPSALTVAGSPVDQFSFLESDDGYLNVVVRGDAFGDAMWSAEWGARGMTDSMALLRAPLAGFDDGRAQARAGWYRPLPAPRGGVFHNRFVGDHLLYGGGNGWWYPTRNSATAFVVPWKGGDVTLLDLPHGVDRIEVMGPDAVIVGAGGGNLHFSGVRLGAHPVVVQRFVLDSASQGELRSHGFFYQADDERSGTLGLPVRGGVRPGYEHLIYGSASVVFLQNESRQFTRLGALASATDEPVDDGCKASCVDWYGNARPIFLRGRTFALLGYELVEGAVTPGGLHEVRRASFAPALARTTLRE